MRSPSPSRLTFGATLLLFAASIVAAHAQPQRYMPPSPPRQWARPRPRFLPAPVPGGGAVLLAQNGPNRPAQNRPGLELWMQQHRNLSPTDQQRALQGDPSFRALPPQAQIRTLNELRRLQGMNPEALNRRRALLRMTPAQREQFDTAMQQYAALPPPRQQLIGRVFAALRRIPPRDRASAMATFPPLQQLSPVERQTLQNLLAWEPYMTAPDPTQ